VGEEVVSLRPRSALFPYQREKSIPAKIDRRQVAEFVPVGMGKTISTLTALVDLGMPKTLTLAPPRVARRVWSDEARLWEHTKDVRVNPLVGTPEQRLIRLAHKSDMDVISFDLFPWLVDTIDIEKVYGAIVFDELDKMKNPNAKWFKRMRTRSTAIPIRIGQTGTPIGNHYRNLWGEMFAVAGEKPLGPSKVQFMMQYFTAYEISEHVKGWSLNYGAADMILERIKPYAFSLDPKDAPKLPPVQLNPIHVELPKKVRDLSDELARELKVQLASGADLIALSSSARAAKVRQMAGGAVYLADGETWEEIHTEKLDALEDLIDELQGEPLVCFYWFKHELERLRKRFPNARLLRTEADEEAWNSGKVELMLAHPASAGHGLNLQFGGHNLCFYTLPWSWIFFSQSIGRLPRPGQKSPFVMGHVLLAGESDLAVYEFLAEMKAAQEHTMQAVRI
jgi:hypothetical protein